MVAYSKNILLMNYNTLLNNILLNFKLNFKIKF